MEPVTGEAVADDEAAAAQDADGPEANSPDTDNADTDNADTDNPRTDSPNSVSPEADSPKTDSPKTDSPNSDSPNSDSSDADSSATGEPAEQESPGIAEALAASAPPRADRVRRWTAALLAMAGCVLLGVATFAELQAHSLRSDQASNNTALTDAAATSQVQRQVDSAINTVFSYNYADTGTTRAAAQRLLTGAAVREYDSLFKLVEADAPAQHLVLTTKVTNSGVELLEGDRARVLIFADQRDTRMTTHQTSYAGAMFAVNAVRQGGRWKIENIDTFTGS